MLEWIVTITLITLPMTWGIIGRRSLEGKPKSKFSLYLRDIVGSLAIIMLYLAIKPELITPIKQTGIYKGIEITADLLASVTPFFAARFLLSLTPWDITYPAVPNKAKEIFGYPASHLPDTTKQLLAFVCYIIVGVLFEELLYRQFLFYSLYHTFRLEGDLLVIVSAFVFAAGHLYQGWKGLISAFITGLLLGKVYLTYESISYPIVLHLLLNGTLVIIAFKWIRDKKRFGYIQAEKRDPQ